MGRRPPRVTSSEALGGAGALAPESVSERRPLRTQRLRRDDLDIGELQAAARGLFPDLLGIRLVKAEPERVVAELDVRPDLCTIPGRMHGGAIMAFADQLGAVGTVLNLREGQGTTTIESKTNFLGSGREGTTVVGTCEALHRGRRTMVWQTTIRDGDRLIAIVTQTQMVLEP